MKAEYYNIGEALLTEALEVRLEPGLHPDDEFPLEEVRRRYADILPPQEGMVVVAQVDGLHGSTHYVIEEVEALSTIFCLGVKRLYSMRLDLWEQYKHLVEVCELPAE